MAAQDLDVGDEVGGGVVVQAAEWAGPAGSTLVENDDPPVVRVEETAVHCAGTRARTAMQEQHGAAVWVAGFLPVHDVSTGQRQVAGLVGAYLGEQVAA